MAMKDSFSCITWQNACHPFNSTSKPRNTP